MMTSTVRKGVTAAASVASAALALGVFVAAPHAHATASAGWIQRAAYCEQTTDGKACVAVQELPSGKPYVRSQWRGVFALTPAAGHVMSPASWTTANPGFAGTDHRFCTTSCPKSRPWVGYGGSMSLESIVGFAYNTPGKTHSISAGKGTYSLGVTDGTASLYEYTTWTSENNLHYSQMNAHVYAPYPSIETPVYVRLFFGDGGTITSDRLCPTNQASSVCSGPRYLSIRTPLARSAYGAAAKVSSSSTALVAKNRVDPHF